MEKRWEAKNDDASNHEREVSTKGTSGKVLKTTLPYLMGGIDPCLFVTIYFCTQVMTITCHSPLMTYEEEYISIQLYVLYQLNTVFHQAHRVSTTQTLGTIKY